LSRSIECKATEWYWQSEIECEWAVWFWKCWAFYCELSEKLCLYVCEIYDVLIMQSDWAFVFELKLLNSIVNSSLQVQNTFSRSDNEIRNYYERNKQSCMIIRKFLKWVWKQTVREQTDFKTASKKKKNSIDS